MKLNIKELLDFFDDRKDSERGDANALITLLGEELNASTYKHFRKDKVEILNRAPSFGTKKGNRLDRWIVDRENNRLLQCEIKNWAASAIDGKRLKSDASDEDTRRVVEYNWKNQLRNEDVYISMPKFTFTTKYTLNDNLKEMGMPSAFSEAADFSGINGNKDLFIQTVIHQAFVDVNATAPIEIDSAKVAAKPEIRIILVSCTALATPKTKPKVLTSPS